MGPAVVKGDLEAEAVAKFFDPKGIVTVEARNQAVNGQCTKKDKTCKGGEIRDSRVNDMRTSMYLLGNAFRFNQQKAPDNLPTVKAAKAFFKDLDDLEKFAPPPPGTKKKGQGNGDKFRVAYLRGLEKLDVYLDLVELPPTESGAYDQEFDTRVSANARIT